MAKKIENTVKLSPEANANAKVLAETSKQIVSSAKDLGKAVQTHMENIMMHVIQYRDARPALQFVVPLAMADKHGKKQSILRTNAISAWLSAHAFARISEDKLTGKMTVKTSTKALDKVLSGGNEAINAHVKDAKAAIWNKVSKEPVFTAFDLFARFESLIKTATEKSLEKNADGTPKNKVTAAQIKQLKDIEANMKAFAIN